MRQVLRKLLSITLHMGVLVLLSPVVTSAQGNPSPVVLEPFTQQLQGWNNCGPATLTVGLSHFGYTGTQIQTAAWLRPNSEDKSVNPRQMMTYVNTELQGVPVRALVRSGGTLAQLKALASSGFPVIIEIGFDPVEDAHGWMGHYLLVKGYDDLTGELITNDSYVGRENRYSYSTIHEVWQHFNNVYLVLYAPEHEAVLHSVLGVNADPAMNLWFALGKTAADTAIKPRSAFVWFNLGTNLAALGQHQAAALAYDTARALGLPWRMMWYQFGAFETYNAVGRYADTIALAQQNLSDGGGQFVEETFFYAGAAREAMGETTRAINNYREAVRLNPNYQRAREALQHLSG